MDDHTFDNLVRALTKSRRAMLGGVRSAAAVRLGVLHVEARQRGKHKLLFNKYGCINVGEKCYGKDAHCCSGIGQGKGKRSRCVAHHVDTCAADENLCPEYIPCGMAGQCYRTTGKAGFCAQAGTCDCQPCRKDKDCEPEFGRGAACIVCNDPCVGVNGSKGTACVPAAV